MSRQRWQGRLMWPVVALILCSCTCCFYICPKVWKQTEADMELPAVGLDDLDVMTHNGDVVVEGTSASESILVHVDIKAGGVDDLDARECLEAIMLETGVMGETQKLGWKWATPRRKTWQATVSFHVVLPSDMSVKVETHNGNVTLDAMRSMARLKTHNGNVNVRDHEGDLVGKTHNGDVKVDAEAPSLRLETHNGGLDVVARVEEVEIRTHNGSISTRLGGVAPLRGNVVTHNGSVKLTLDEDVSTELVATTNNGHISVHREMDMTVNKKKVVVATLGAGGGSLELETFNGSITVR